jgi:spermidine synthase
MLAHIPMFSHANPKKVLIVGGGDGGILREVAKHSCVEKIVHVEIDNGVVEAAKAHFPTVSKAFTDPRLELRIADAADFVATAEAASFDVIIVDSSDPVGPADKLFCPEFYKNASRLLSENGVMASQGECLWIHRTLMKEMVETNGKPFFANVEYASMQVPTYPCGQISAFVCSKQPGSCQVPRRFATSGCEFRYYTPRMHAAAFVLPAFLEKELGLYKEPGSKEFVRDSEEITAGPAKKQKINGTNGTNGTH